MKLPCEMIRDLLPLYHDNVCSEITQAIVAEHLKTCDSCAAALKRIQQEVEVPKLDTDEGKLLRSIRRKIKQKTRRNGILIGLSVFLITLYSWFSLTQSTSVPIDAEDYTVNTVLKLSNGMYYLEYSHPYAAISYGVDIHRTEDGAIHLKEYRPRVVFQKENADPVVRSWLIDPAHDTIHSNTGSEVPLTAFYVGCPAEGSGLLVWSEDMDVPMATPEEEIEYLYKHISNW